MKETDISLIEATAKLVLTSDFWHCEEYFSVEQLTEWCVSIYTQFDTVKVITTRLLSEDMDCSVIVSQTQISCIVNTDKQASRYKPDTMIQYNNLTEDIYNLLVNLDMVMLRAELS